ncbi:MAG: PKD domain-containing protein [Solirubrobacterales bacterium]|nr:PKD domain-containing protein [Solirubrobacterales bacterium]
MISRPLIAVALVVAGLAPAIAPSAGRANALAGVVRDVPTGTHIVHGQIASKRENLPYGGGPVLHSNRTHAIFWEPSGSGLAFESSYESLIETFLVDVAADSHRTTNVYGLSGQYSDARGPAAYDSTYGGAVAANDPLPANGCTEPPMTGPGWAVCLTDAQLETEVEHVIAADHLPTSGRDVYFLITPNGLGSCTDANSSSCALGGSVTGYCGYHSETATGILYAIIPYNAVPGHCQSSNPRPNSNPADPTISTISHEHNEMVTDPGGDAWIDGRGNEDGDLCLTSFSPSLLFSDAIPWNETVHGGHFFLQEEWSNAENSCQPRARPDALWLAGGRVAARARSVSFTAHGSDPEGRMLAFQWFFGDGHIGFGRRISHTFRVAGTYRVTVRSTDSWGNWTFAVRTVRIGER